MNHRKKKEIMDNNKLLCDFRNLKNVKVFPSVKYYYRSELTIPQNQKYCVVEILQADQIVLGKKFALMGGVNPVMIHIVDESFTGENVEKLEGIINENFVMRSNFYKTINTEKL